MEDISKRILEKKESYDSKKDATNMCADAGKKYDNELKKLNKVKDTYFEGINKVVETFLNQKYSKKGENQKSKQDLNNKLKSLEKKKQKTISFSYHQFLLPYLIPQINYTLLS